MAELETDYDRFPYLSQSYVETHVDRLFTMGTLFATDPVPIEGARVLEIACADGANLVPMAERLPDATFVGVDLSARQIAIGRERVEPLGLTNLELRQGSFADLDEAPFDYVIAHGLYSWIDPALRPVLMERIRRHLAPTGIAYVSYNTEPGFSSRKLVRDFLLMHVDEGPAEQRIAQVRQMLRWLMSSSSEDTNEGRVIRGTCQRMMAAPASYLLHGLLAPHNHPLYLRDFVAEAARSGLAYLADADFGSMLGENLHANAQKGLESAPSGFLEQEQVQDFLSGRAFRRSLLVHQGAAINRSIPWERATSLWVSGRPRLLAGGIEDGSEARFDAEGVVFTTDDPVLKHALALLREQWPCNLAFADWVGMTAMRSRCQGIVTRSTLGRNLLHLYGRGVIQLHSRDLGAADQLAERPLVTPWVRRRATLGLPVTDLRHQIRDLPRIPALLAPFLDGESDRKRLHRLVEDAHRHRKVKLDTSVPMAVERALEGLRERSILVAD